MFDPVFSMSEIAKALGLESKVVCGTSYGAIELAIPLNAQFSLLLRQGDEDTDHEVKVVPRDGVNEEHKSNCIIFPKPKQWTPNIYSKGYKDGYSTGLTWEETYIPGGPWYYPPRPHAQQKEIDNANASVENYKNWMAGFKRGLSENPDRKVECK